MKNNQPVTSVEHFLQPGRPIVTKTDRKGIITYANPAFVDISGFTKEELLGQNHNVVRHPDMPVEAFADLWQTVHAGHTWRGLVKNRSKDGGFYWVDAFVTPITDNGQITGYISVRSTPQRSAVAEAEKLYAAIRNKQAKMPATVPPRPASRDHLAFIGTQALCAPLAIAAAFMDGTPAIVLGGAAAALALGAATLVHTRIFAPLDALRRHILRIDEGQLDQALEPRSTGALASVTSQAEALRVHLKAMFADVLVATREVNGQAVALEKSCAALMTASDEQGERVMQAAAAMEEMSTSVNEISSNTEISTQAAQETETALDQAQSDIENGISSSSSVIAVVNSARDQIVEMDAALQNIGNVSQIIQEIAEQTNLLALNAAIEAARAGEQGRGFAVVADEVRKLAERTALSTAEISASIAEVGTKSNRAMSTIEAAAKDVQTGFDQVAQSADSLNNIRQASQRTTEVAREIRSMLEQQAAASEDVASAMESISARVERNHDSVTQVGASIRGLTHISGELNELIRHIEKSIQ